MHSTAMMNFQNFVATYESGIASTGQKIRVVEVGSQDVNGSLRSISPPSFEYIGVDFVAGKGVDVVLTDPYSLPFEDGFADVVVSSSCFEHSEMFWLLFLEIMRITKSSGLFYLNVPSNGEFHRWPVDCWRFYPDSGRALTTWARRNGLNVALLESYTSTQIGDQWNDFVAVFLKDVGFISQYPLRILDSKTDIGNGLKYGSDDFVKYGVMPEDKFKLQIISQIIANQVKLA